MRLIFFLLWLITTLVIDTNAAKQAKAPTLPCWQKDFATTLAKRNRIGWQQPPDPRESQPNNPDCWYLVPVKFFDPLGTCGPNSAMCPRLHCNAPMKNVACKKWLFDSMKKVFLSSGIGFLYGANYQCTMCHHQTIATQCKLSHSHK